MSKPSHCKVVNYNNQSHFKILPAVANLEAFISCQELWQLLQTVNRSDSFHELSKALTATTYCWLAALTAVKKSSLQLFPCFDEVSTVLSQNFWQLLPAVDTLDKVSQWSDLGLLKMIFLAKEQTTDTINLTFAHSWFAVGGLSMSRLEVVKKKEEEEEDLSEV